MVTSFFERGYEPGLPAAVEAALVVFLISVTLLWKR
jgi:hypothetical protein